MAYQTEVDEREATERDANAGGLMDEVDEVKEIDASESLGGPKPRRKWLLAGALVVAAVIVTLAWRHYAGWESTDDAVIDGHINSISSRVSGHVLQVNFEDNQYVQAGTVLVQLDPQDYQVALDRASAELANADAASEAAHVGVPITSVSTSSAESMAGAGVESAQAGVVAVEKQLAAARAKVRDAEANNTKAQADLERYKQLVGKQEVSEQQYDQAVAAAQSTAATVAAAEADAAASGAQVLQARGRLGQAQAELRSSETGPQQVRVKQSSAAAAAAAVKKAQAALEQARLNLQYTTIKAPVSGLVAKRSVEVGQNVQAGQDLMALVPLDDLWVTANFKETQLKNMKPGQPVVIHVDAYGRDYQGYVENIAGGTGSMFSLLPPENATGNYVKVVQRVPVRIRFKPGEDTGHRLRLGMSVEPRVRVN